MLKKIEITNFKNFENRFVFDLSNAKSFEFNKECVDNGLIKKALIYGKNGIGKSNLGFAIFDLISHLTDKNSGSYSYKNYINANSSEAFASFRFEFQFEQNSIVYEYTKSNVETLIQEKLTINDNEYLSIDRSQSSVFTTNAKGAETLTKDIGKSAISIISYIDKNALLDEEDENNRCFKKFLAFVNGMLFFRSLEFNNYIGFEQGSGDIGSDIIEKGHLKAFEKFLNEAGIECKLGKIKTLDKFDLAFKFGKKLLPFWDIASQGTRSLALFYYWFQRLEEDDISFVFVDEFDAFYHHLLSAMIIKRLKEIKAQVIVTTHNTSMMTNELLRPDCYFIMKKETIKSISNLTAKELREAHNLEKMYKAGSFV